MFNKRRLAPFLMAIVLVGGIGLTHAESVGAASIGQYQQARVQCNWRSHTITLTAAASPAPGLDQQDVYFHYWLFDVTAGQWVSNFAPTLWGHFPAWSFIVDSYGQRIFNTGVTTYEPWTVQNRAHPPSFFSLPPSP